MKSQKSIWDKEYQKHENKWKQQRNSFPKIMKDKSVLEIGVGNGKNLLSIISQNPKSITAIDISEEALKKCAKYIRNKNSKIQLIKSNITKTSFDNNQFDVIICYYVLNNLLEKDRKKAVSEMKRILSDKSIILFEDFSEGDYRQFSKEKRETKPEKNTIIRKSGLIQHFFTKPELLSLFSKFKSIKIKEISFNQVKARPDLKRKLIQAIIRK